MGFLHDFLFHNEGNEIPKRYLVWSAYGALSAVIGRRVYIDLQHLVVTPNLYILLVGTAGSRKTSARDKAFDMVREAFPLTVFSGDNDTYQGIITAMERDDKKIYFNDVRPDGTPIKLFYRPYCIFASEFHDYIQNNPLGMVAFLTNIYDRRHYVYRLKNEDRVLDYPYVMMLACCPPEWLTDQIKAKQFQAGYGRRTVLVCNDGYKRKKPELTDDQRAAWSRCVLHLRSLADVSGQMRLEPEAEKWFWDWYMNPPKCPDDPFFHVWRESLHINLLKVAMMISLGERTDKVITLAYVQLAMEQLMDVEDNLPMVTSKLGRSEVNEAAARLLSIIRSSGGFVQEKVLKIKTLKEFRDMTEQWKTIEWLKSTDQIKAVPKDGKVYLALPECVKEGPREGPKSS